MKLLLHYLKKQKGYLAIGLLLFAVSQTFNYLNPYFLGHLIIDPFASKVDYYRSHGQASVFFHGIAKGLILIVAGSTITWICNGYKSYFIGIAIQRFNANLFFDIQRHTLSLPYAEFENERSGEILSLLQSARADTEAFVMAFVNVLFVAIIGTVVITVIAIQLNPLIPIFYAFGVVTLYLITKRSSKKVTAIQDKILHSNISLFGSATESIRNIELVKSLGLTEQEISRFDTTIKNILQNELLKVKKLNRVSLKHMALNNMLHQAVIFLLLLFLFYGSITIGQLLMLQIYFYYIFGTLHDLGSVISAYRKAEASLKKIEQLLARPTHTSPTNAPSVGAIESLSLQHVSFRHRASRRNNLEDISFEAFRGETIAIVGPSGSGKTTLIKLLLGLYDPSQGAIFYNGQNSQGIEFDSVRHQVALVTQDTQLFSGSIRENMLFVNPTATDEMILKALHDASCSDLLDRADKLLDTRIGEGGLSVSGGERQRLSIARALLREANLAIFDEATSSLDALTAHSIDKTIRRIIDKKEFITLIVSHRLPGIMFADRIVVLERGRIVECGDHITLLAQKGLYYAMWRQQIGEWESAMAPSPQI